MRASRWFLAAGVLVAGAVFAWWLLWADHIPQHSTYHAGSKIEDKEALGGFGPSGNYPQDLTGHDWGEADRVSLVAFPDESGTQERFPIRLINRTGAVAGFAACDSCLYLTQEAMDRAGNWRPIERPPVEICGNSLHRVFLDKNQYWEFSVRRTSGTVKTRLRFRLDQGTLHREERGWGEGEKHTLVFASPGGPVIYSNEFEGRVNPSLYWLAGAK